jgi:hypothetical protein
LGFVFAFYRFGGYQQVLSKTAALKTQLVRPEDKALQACNLSAVPDGYTARQGWKFSVPVLSLLEASRQKTLFSLQSTSLPPNLWDDNSFFYRETE